MRCPKCGAAEVFSASGHRFRCGAKWRPGRFVASDLCRLRAAVKAIFEVGTTEEDVEDLATELARLE